MLEPDSLSRSLDQNAVQCPSSLFEPRIQAVLHENPNYDFTKLHLIADRSTLARLLELANDRTIDNKDKPERHQDDERAKAFSFGGEVVGGTIIFTHNDNAVVKTITKVQGFSKDFGDKYLAFPHWS